MQISENSSPILLLSVYILYYNLREGVVLYKKWCNPPCEICVSP